MSVAFIIHVVGVITKLLSIFVFMVLAWLLQDLLWYVTSKIAWKFSRSGTKDSSTSQGSSPAGPKIDPLKSEPSSSEITAKCSQPDSMDSPEE